MAEVQPLRTLRYEPSAVGLARGRDRAALRRDRRRAARRARRPAARTTWSRSTCRRRDGGDPYEHARDDGATGASSGVLVREDEPAVWVLRQDYTAPDGARRTRDRVLRARARGGLRAGPDPPARAHPPRARRRTASTSPAPRAPTSPPSSASSPTRDGAAGRALEQVAAERAVRRRRPTTTARATRSGGSADAGR